MISKLRPIVLPATFPFRRNIFSDTQGTDLVVCDSVMSSNYQGRDKITFRTFMKYEDPLPSHNSPPLEPVMSHFNSVHIISPHFSKIQFNIMFRRRLGLSVGLFPEVFPQKSVCLFRCYMFRQSHSPWFTGHNSTRWIVQTMKLSVMWLFIFFFKYICPKKNKEMQF